ncbi:glycoside hydrolase superfamily [Cladochytrium replicatum]|nr:glycoside hydrolase superfamily [Cladochytrium replicatum]
MVYEVDPSSGGGSEATMLKSIVTYDRHSLIVNGKRLNVWSAEMHPWRLPSPSLWRDVLLKLRRAGYNAVSIYVNWGYHSPKKGVYDFNGIRSWDTFLTHAEEVGIYVMFRPGPYINAETTGGGLPTWLGCDVKEMARTHLKEYRAVWEPYFAAVNAIAARYQVRRDVSTGKVIGCVVLYQIENEFSTSQDPEYMTQLRNRVRAAGVHVPIFHNDAWNNGSWARGKGSVDIYAWDGYPNGFDAKSPKNWSPVPDVHGQFYNRHKADAPMFIAEFQGGTLDFWGGCGYHLARKLTDYDFVRVFCKNNLIAGVTMQNFYMTYGGTNWGHVAKTLLYSSYDFGGAITEDRRLTEKYYENKLIAYFLEAAGDHLAKTDRVYAAPVHNTSKFAAPVSIHSIRNLDTGAQFFLLRHADPSQLGRDETKTPEEETSYVSFSLDREYRRVPAIFPDSENPTIGPQTGIAITARQAKLLAAHYPFGTQYIVYSTADIMTHTDLGDYEVLVLYAEDAEFSEIVLKADDGVQVKPLLSSRTLTHKREGDAVRINFQHEKFSPIWVQNIESSQIKPLLIIAASREVAYKIWKIDATTTINSDKTLPVVIKGPYLVRSIHIDANTRSIDIRGDLDTATALDVWTPIPVNQVLFNGSVVPHATSTWKSLHGLLRGPPQSVNLPKLKRWQISQDDARNWKGTPEIDAFFDDSKWLSCDKTTTYMRSTHFETPVLFADDYGFHVGHLNYRGTFKSKRGNETGITITADGGDFYIYCLYLNSHLLGHGTLRDKPEHFSFPPDTVCIGSNTLYVLIDHMGRDDDWDAQSMDYKNYRGLKSAVLDFAIDDDAQEHTAVEWKVQGNRGGEDIVDAVRGVYAVGGLYGERHGWHLPGFCGRFADGKGWRSLDVSDQVVLSHSHGVQWFRTGFNLDISSKLDVPIFLCFDQNRWDNLPFKQRPAYRAQFYINGWLLGRYINNFGPQTEFPIPEGILNHRGHNTLAIAVWDFSEKDVLLPVSSYVPVFLKAVNGVYVYGGPPVGLVDSPGYDEKVYGYI